MSQSARRLAALRSLPGLARVSTDEVAALAAVAEERFVPRGALLLRRGEPPARAYVLVEGRARPAVPVLGGLELIAGVPIADDAVAETDVLVLALRRADVVDFFEESFTATLATMRGLAGEILAHLQRGDGGFHPFRGAGGPGRAPSTPLSLADRLLHLHTGLVMGQSRLEAIAALAQVAHEERRPRGTLLWRAGDRAASGWSLVAGEVECRRAGRPSYRVRPPLDVGVVEAYAGAPRWYDAVAASDIVALRLDMTDVVDVIEDHTELAHDVLRTLAMTLLQLGRP